MDELAKGNLAVDIPFVDQTNEVGRIARSLQVFKDHLVEIDAAPHRAGSDENAFRRGAADGSLPYRRRLRAQHWRGDREHRHRRRRAAEFRFVDVHDRGGDDGSERQGRGRGRADRIERSDRRGLGGGAVVLDPGDLAAGHPVFVHCPERGRAGQPNRGHGRAPGRGLAKDRRGHGADPDHRGTDQPAGAERHHRGRPGRRSGQGLCRRGQRGQGAVVANRQGHRRNHQPDSGNSRRDRLDGQRRSARSAPRSGR